AVSLPNMPKVNEHPLQKVLDGRKLGAEYFLGLAKPCQLSAQDYADVRLAAGANATVIYNEWRDWLQLLKSSKVRAWSDVAARTSVSSLHMFKVWSARQRNSSPNAVSPSSVGPSASPLEPSASSSSKQDEPSISPVESPIAASSSSSSTASSSTGSLTQGALRRMRSAYSATFKEYEGVPWLLPSGANVDEIVYRYTMTLEVESSLHSFVIDRAAALDDCFDSDGDREAFQKRLKADMQETALVLPCWQQQELLRYALQPQELEVTLSKGWAPSLNDVEGASIEHRAFRKRLYLAMLRLSSLYEEYGLSLPDTHSESWYTTNVWGTFLDLLAAGSEWLEYKPGEVCSTASSLRRNSDRDLESRHAQGRKIDGLIFCKKTQCEVGAVEVGKVDGGATGTKVLKDGRKMAKLLKDMADTICSRMPHKSEARRDFRVFGLLISGLRAQFVTLRYLDGRFCQLQRGRTVALPLTWDEHSIRSVLVVINEMLLLRGRMEAMAELAYNYIHPGPEDLLRELSGKSRACTPPSAYIPTLTTPKSSPKRSRESKIKFC
ncbi:hypothetical protein BGZ70_005106, partial [Mortierella alpina]